MMRNYCLMPVIFLCAAEWVKFTILSQLAGRSCSQSRNTSYRADNLTVGINDVYDRTSSVLSSSLYRTNPLLSLDVTPRNHMRIMLSEPKLVVCLHLLILVPDLMSFSRTILLPMRTISQKVTSVI